MLGSSRIITQSGKMRSLLSRVETIAASDGPVLLVGETGVGKELFADHIHRASPRRNAPFVGVALSAMPHDLLESELFGHERGAFTSAVSDKKGLFEVAHHGTVFLDDIDDVPGAIQSKLLRVLETQEIMRVGGTKTIPVDVRLVAASKVDLRDWVHRGLFRPDLYYRISVFPVEIPPLRERREDIPALIQHFMARFRSGHRVDVTDQAMHALSSYAWPGNVRELRNVVQRIALFAGATIHVQDLPAEFTEGTPVERLVRECTRCMREGDLSLHEVVACLERRLLRQALALSSGNQSRAARTLGLNLSTMRDKLQKHGLSGHAPRSPGVGFGTQSAGPAIRGMVTSEGCSSSSASYTGRRRGQGDEPIYSRTPVADRAREQPAPPPSPLAMP